MPAKVGIPELKIKDLTTEDTEAHRGFVVYEYKGIVF
ncbi:hypothetical protein MNBD_GAMMA23-1788 [hydrothermal vent metagenome]|uniref:Uncharacterized protein n=1 Tax=hydrothermal vent metagenome TaxID=652676 RepID=A0A3B1A9H8_9ZZZZ